MPTHTLRGLLLFCVSTNCSFCYLWYLVLQMHIGYSLVTTLAQKTRLWCFFHIRILTPSRCALCFVSIHLQLFTCFVCYSGKQCLLINYIRKNKIEGKLRLRDSICASDGRISFPESSALSSTIFDAIDIPATTRRHPRPQILNCDVYLRMLCKSIYTF